MNNTERSPENVDMLRVDVPCMFGCPAQTDVPGYIRMLYEKDYDRSYAINRVTNLFPGSLGRVCTRPCEAVCRHGYAGYGEPVSICRLKRAASDYCKDKSAKRRKQKQTGKKTAIIGGGPPGLAAARDLLFLGHHVSIYEASNQLGGMMPLAIPQFRLAKKVIQEDIVPILELRPRLFLNTTLGIDIHLKDLTKNNDAVLLAVGCQRSYRLNVPGESVDGVFYGLEFLIDSNRGKKNDVGNKVLIVGGGYTAVDCARTLVRLGVADVVMAYRRTPKEIAIDSEEMHHLEMEDVRIRYLTAVTSFISGENGRLEKVELVRTRLENGKVKPIQSSKRKERFDSAIICIGQGACGESFITKEFAPFFEDERLVVDQKTFMSRFQGLFGTGDYVNRSRSLIDAIADGRKAALGIHAFLTSIRMRQPEVINHPISKTNRERSDDFIPRVSERLTIGTQPPRLKQEVACGFSRDECHQESKRCYLCNLHYEIDIDNCIYCMRCIDEAPVDCIKQVKKLGAFKDGKRDYELADTWNEIGIIYIDNDCCVRCNKCLEICPTRCISVTAYQLVDPIFGENV